MSQHASSTASALQEDLPGCPEESEDLAPARFREITELARRTLDVPLAFVTIHDAGAFELHTSADSLSEEELGSALSPAVAGGGSTIAEFMNSLERSGYRPCGNETLRLPSGAIAGRLWVADRSSRKLSEKERAALGLLAADAAHEIEAVRKRREASRDPEPGPDAPSGDGSVGEAELPDVGAPGISLDWEPSEPPEDANPWLAIIESHPEGLFVTIDGCIEYANPAAVRLLGAGSPSDLRSRLLKEFAADDLSAESLHRMTAGEGSFRIRVRSLDGKVRLVEAQTASVVWNGRPAVQMAARDVTENHRAEEIIRKRALLFDATSDSVLLSDEQGILAWNAASERLFGYAPEEILGKSPELLNRPGEGEAYLRRIRAAIGAEGRWQGESTLMHRDGSEVWCETTVVPIHDPEGETIAWMSRHRDVTGPKRTEDTIRQGLTFLDSIIENMPVSVLVKDAEHLCYVRCNRAAEALFDVRRDDLLGQNAGKLVAAEEAKRTVQKDREVLSTGVPLDEEETLLIQGKAPRTLRTRRVPLFDDDGRPAYVLVISEDVTEQKQTEIELVGARNRAEEASRLKSAFLANMSHEIRTPLTTIIGFADVLSDELDGRDGEFVSFIRKGAQRLMQTLDSVIDLAQLESGAFTLQPERIDVSELVAENVRLFHLPASEKGLDLRFGWRPEPACLHADAAALNRIVGNLLSNAVKFTPSGTILVDVESDRDQVRITVEDTGIGISQSYLPFVFDAFQQESNGMNREFEGSGIGLRLTRSLVDLMGGRIEVVSRKGSGTKFTVCLPRSRSKTADPTESDMEMEKDKRHALLIVDDDANTRALLLHLLGKKYDIRMAHGAEDALQAAGTNVFDLVIMDIHLGSGPSGDVVLKDLRQVPGYEAIPVIALTAYALPGDKKRFLDAGFDAYLSKPFTRNLIEGMLEQFLPRKNP